MDTASGNGRGDSARGSLHPGHQHARLRVGGRCGGGGCGGSGGLRAAAACIQLLALSMGWQVEARGHEVYRRVEGHATGGSKGYYLRLMGMGAARTHALSHTLASGRRMQVVASVGVGVLLHPRRVSRTASCSLHLLDDPGLLRT